MKSFIILFALVLCSILSFGQLVPGKPSENGMSAERLERMDKFYNDLVAKKQIPGAVVFIARNGKVVYHKAFGYSDVEKQTALKKDDIFRIASQTKAVTSLAVMMLFEEGKLLLDEPISKYIPEFKSPKVIASFNAKDSTYTTTPAKSEITIRHLLSHTSGIDYAGIGSPDFRAIYAKAGVPSGIGTNNIVLADKMKILGGLPLKHNPGEQYTYSLSVDVLGYLVEILSGMSLDQFFKTRIFQPLGMSDTYFYLPKEKHSRLVGLYTTKEGAVFKLPTSEAFNTNYPQSEGKYYSGGAGLSSSIEDYAKFIQLFINKGEFNGVRLISRKTVELMLTNQTQAPIINQFGLGFGLETEKNDYQSILSVGSFQWGGAFNTQYWGDPKERLVGVIYTNMFGSPINTGDKFKIFTYQTIVD
ncbi:serine hydrolase domain-containing protein [soil metagenome]